MTKQISFKDTEKHFESIMNFDDLKDLTTKEIKSVAILMEHVRLNEKEKTKFGVFVDFDDTQKTCENNPSCTCGLKHKEVVRKYVKRGTIEAIQVTNMAVVTHFFGVENVSKFNRVHYSEGVSYFELQFKDMIFQGKIGDYITRDSNNNYSVVSKKEFEQTYSEVKNND